MNPNNRDVSRSIFLLLAIMILLASCAYGGETVLKYNDVQSFEERELQSVPVVSLEVSGLAFHSSSAVERIKTEINNDNLNVQVYLVLARKGLSGSFSYRFDVPPEVNSVSFGSVEDIIWKRGIGPIK